MQVTINNQIYTYSNNISDNDKIRHSFNALATQTFGLSFENWYNAGYWTDKYVPHVLLDEDTVVANVSVNILDCKLNEESKRFVQLGTVMTKESYRGRGLSRFLIETVLAEWVDKCDGIYLYANDSVTDFYPRFGFNKSEEHQYKIHTLSGAGTATQLDMDNEQDIALLLKSCDQGNPFSALSLIENNGLVMFYCSQCMNNNVYYCKDQETVVIAEFDGDTMTCYDVFGSCSGKMQDILLTVAKPETKHITLGFTPKESSEMQAILIQEENSTFFWYGSNDCLFKEEKLMFPLLSHA